MNDLKEIGEEIKTQDNMATAHPFFILYDKQKLPTDSDYSDEYFYHDSPNDCAEIEGTKEALIEYCKDLDFLPDDIDELDEGEVFDVVQEHTDITKVYFLEIDVFVQAFFTKKSAEQFLEVNHYHYNKPHIYCVSLWRNYEMQAIRDALMNGKFPEKVVEEG